MNKIGVFVQMNENGKFYIIKSSDDGIHYLVNSTQYDEHEWSSSIKDAKLFDDELMAENWAYTATHYFKYKGYTLVPLSYGLYPCAIKYGNLYLKKKTCRTKQFFYSMVQLPPVYEFTTDLYQALTIKGPDEGIKMLKEIADD